MRAQNCSTRRDTYKSMESKLHIAKTGFNRFLSSLFKVILGPAILFLFSCHTVPWELASSLLELPEPPYKIKVRRNVMIPMGDGVRLAADIYHPDTTGEYPAILIRTPYNKRDPVYGYEIFGGLFASQGYVIVIQDVRGKFGSEGDFYPVINEGSDGADTIRWMSSQRWCNGKIGMFGISYFGATEWLVTPLEHETLVTVVPIFTTQSAYDLWLTGGVFNYNLTFTWHYRNDARKRREMNIIEWKKGVWTLPLISACNSLGVQNPIYDDWISHPVPGPFWDRMRVDNQVGQIQCPALMVAGWFDPFLSKMLDDYNRIRDKGGSTAARSSRLIIGPWNHVTESRYKDTHFTEEARFLGQIKTIFRWYNHWLKNEVNGIEKEAPIRIFVMGKNEWRNEQEWPLARTRYTRYYLHSMGNANTSNGDGYLSLDSPTNESPDVFVYDPEDPVPSIDMGKLFISFSYIPVDQKEVEARQDVLVYSTDPFREELEVTGPVKLVLNASTSALDTDFTVKLTDVYPDGRSVLVSAGIIRARFRESLTNPSLLEPGRVYRYEIEVGATSLVFAKDHRIRIQVSSSDFPRRDRNLNTGAEIGLTAEMIQATQTVYHDDRYASYLLLPVIP
jgi:putative CocE/NonD family hydrolase